MRHGLAILALMVPLAGCVVPPDGGGYPGYAYNGGAPTYAVDGIPQPLIFYGGSWGYYDSYRRFHRAPDGVHRQLEARYPGGGGGYRPYAGGGYSRPVEAPRYGVNQGGYRPAATGFGGFRPPAAQYSAPRQASPAFAAPHPAFAAPQRSAPSGNQSSATHRRRDDDHR